MKIPDVKTFPTFIGRNQLIVKVETDEERAGREEFRIDGPSFPRRRDGAITNWRISKPASST